MAESAEIERGQRDAPGRIEPVAVFQALQQCPRSRVDVNETQSRPVGFMRIVALMQGIGYDDIVADGLHIEWDVAPWQPQVLEGAEGSWNGVKRIVVDIHAAQRKVRRIETLLSVDHRAGE